MLVRFLSENNLPMNIIDSQSFKVFVSSLNVNYLPLNRQQMSKTLIPTIYELDKEKIKKELCELDEYVY